MQKQTIKLGALVRMYQGALPFQSCNDISEKFMRFHFSKRWVALLLLGSILFLSACSVSDGGDETEVRLVIEEASPLAPYTDQQRNTAASALLEVFCATLLDREGLVLSGKPLEKAETVLREKVLAILEARISFEDFEELHVTNFDWSTPRSLAHSYVRLIRVVGTEAGGRLAYELLHLYLTESESTARENYLLYGRSWDLVNAERYARQAGELAAIPVSDFSVLCAMLSLCASTTDLDELWDTDSSSAEEIASLLLTFVRRQSALLGQLSAESLSVAGKLIFELVFYELSPPEGATTLEAEEWYALAENGEAAALMGATLYDFFAFYRQLAAEMTPADAEALLSGDADTVTKTLCSLCVRCEDGMLVWLEKLSACRFASEEERLALVQLGLWDAFEGYRAERQTVLPADLFAALTVCRDDPSSASREALIRTAEDFAFGIAPYATYVFYGLGR